MTTTEFKEGDTVRVTGRRGVYVVKRDAPASDGSILLFGGSIGRRGWKSVTPDRLRHVKPGRTMRETAGGTVYE